MFGRFKKFSNHLEATISGWRFDNLRDQLSSVIVDNAKFAPVIKNIDAKRTAEIAFVTPLPPQDTGIATCSFYSIIDFPINVDVFSPSPIGDWVSALEKMANSKSDTVRIYSTDQFLTLDSISHYKAIVVAIGNSDHHAYVFEFLKKVGAFQGLRRVWLYVHDPVSLNLIQCGKSLSNVEFLDYIKELYPDKENGSGLKGVFSQKWELHSFIANENVLGLRAFTSIGIKNFIVNSSAAKEFLAADIENDNVVQQIFHPCFLPINRDGFVSPEKSTTLKIGTFGIPGGSKLTKSIVEACDHLEKSGHQIELYIAGFNVHNFWRSYNFTKLKLKCHLFDGPTDIQLVEIMNKIDVAVQLRDVNRGESSGIIPQLLMLNKAVVVSDLGSFKEFGAAVITFDNQTDVKALATKILEARTNYNPRAVSDYSESHSVSRFQNELISKVLV
jgi:hypothetical protein